MGIDSGSGYTFLFVLASAFLLDYLIGDPPYLPHPVKIIGKGITVLEHLLRRADRAREKEKITGILLTVLIVASTFVIAYMIEKWVLFGLGGFLRYTGLAFLVYLTSTTLATRELMNAGIRVIRAVKADDMDTARHHLSMIVGRDVEYLDRKGVLKATIETLSENLSDGIVAPLFYLAIGGMPLGLAYKAINTLDSMVGYRTERYINFGWASARLDDFANYIPARISGFLVAASSGILFKSKSAMVQSLATMYHDGKNHLSPNSGYPEAAMAGALGVRLGGPSTYNGLLVEKPYIGKENVTDYLQPSFDAVRIIKLSSFIGLFLSLATLLFLK